MMPLYLIYYRRKLKNGRKKYYLNCVQGLGYTTLDFELEPQEVAIFEEATGNRKPFELKITDLGN